MRLHLLTGMPARRYGQMSGQHRERVYENVIAAPLQRTLPVESVSLAQETRTRLHRGLVDRCKSASRPFAVEQHSPRHTLDHHAFLHGTGLLDHSRLRLDESLNILFCHFSEFIFRLIHSPTRRKLPCAQAVLIKIIAVLRFDA